MKLREKILITGACGQIGSALARELRNLYGESNVITTDIVNRNPECQQNGPFELLDVLDKSHFFEVVKHNKITQIYHLAAVLSAKGEKNPLFTWNLNLTGLLNVLEMAREQHLEKVFWPSSIAVFGDHTPKEQTPQYTVTEPNTVYGISKIAGENWCAYYHNKFGVDVRSIRYPGLIGYNALPGGGTTDYAVDIFHKALNKEVYSCYLLEDTALPMLYMPDAIRAAIEIMQTAEENIHIHTSYNVAGMSFTPKQLAKEIQKHISDLTINYEPDYRQKIAESWPASIDDTSARSDWGWKAEFDIANMTTDMLNHLRKMKKEHV